MALATTQRRVYTSTLDGATTTFSPTTTVAEGSLAVLSGCGQGATKTISSVADSVGNTWAVNVTGGSGRVIGFASAQIIHPITSSNTITITWTTATADFHYIWVMEVTGAAKASAFDKSALGSGSGTAITSGPTAELAQPEEICFAASITGGGSVWTKDPAWSNPATPSQFEASLEYLIVSSTSGVTATGTWSPSTSWELLIATYKAAPTANLAWIKA